MLEFDFSLGDLLLASLRAHLKVGLTLFAASEVERQNAFCSVLSALCTSTCQECSFLMVATIFVCQTSCADKPESSVFLFSLPKLSNQTQPFLTNSE